jgi:hypothetical protein
LPVAGLMVTKWFVLFAAAAARLMERSCGMQRH